jgi:alcohol dehydrogenase (cytochrome c)
LATAGRSSRRGKRLDSEHPYVDEFNTGFNPQTTINRSNVDKLKLKWECALTPENFGGRRTWSRDPKRQAPRVQTIALVVDGVAFVADGGNNVYSVDGGSGKPKWTFRAPLLGASGPGLIHTLNFHGGLLYMMSSDCTLYGLDPKTGSPKVKVTGMFPDGGKGYSGRTAPSFYGDVAISGAATPYEVTARGCVAAYDLSKKKVAWRWFAVPPAVPGRKNWDAEAYKGNIRAYPNDWGETDLSGRGSVWAQPVVDQDSGTVYFGTGDPDLFMLDGSMIPGPLLYTNCVVSLDARTGEMNWYHQTTPHDVMSWDICWSAILADIEFEGSRKKVVVAGTKGNYVYVLDAKTGKPIYNPVRVGYNTTQLNANLGNAADMLLSLEPGVYSPGHGGGINAALAVAYNNIYVSTHRMEQRAERKDGTYRGKPMKMVELTDTGSPKFSTISAIDAARGEVRWSHFLSSYYHGAGLVVSAGVLYGVDSDGVLHMLDAESGAPLRKVKLGGKGTTGVSIASTKDGEVRLFVSVGGPNRLLCFALA